MSENPVSLRAAIVRCWDTNSHHKTTRDWSAAAGSLGCPWDSCPWDRRRLGWNSVPSASMAAFPGATDCVMCCLDGSLPIACSTRAFRCLFPRWCLAEVNRRPQFVDLRRRKSRQEPDSVARNPRADNRQAGWLHKRQAQRARMRRWLADKHCRPRCRASSRAAKLERPLRWRVIDTADRHCCGRLPCGIPRQATNKEAQSPCSGCHRKRLPRSSHHRRLARSAPCRKATRQSPKGQRQDSRSPPMDTTAPWPDRPPHRGCAWKPSLLPGWEASCSTVSWVPRTTPSSMSVSCPNSTNPCSGH